MIASAPTLTQALPVGFMYEPALPPSIPADVTVAEHRRSRSVAPQGLLGRRGRLALLGAGSLASASSATGGGRRRRGPRNDPMDEITSGGW